jgi:hypothetical protein
MGTKEVQILKKNHLVTTPEDESELLSRLPQQYSTTTQRGGVSHHYIMHSTWNLCADIANKFAADILAKLEEALEDFDNYTTSKDGDFVYLAEAKQTIKEAKRMIDEYKDKAEEG